MRHLTTAGPQRAGYLLAVVVLWQVMTVGQTSAAGLQNDNARRPTVALPEAPYAPLGPGQKFTTFAAQLYSPLTFAAAGVSGGWGQMTDSPPEYGAGIEGYGKRFGCALADAELSNFFNKFFYPAILRQDPRYFPARPGRGLWWRTRYAATRVLITRNDRGHNQFNYSEAFGNLSNAALDNAYFAPSQRTFGKTMFRVGSLFAVDALANLGREFGPDMWRMLRGKSRAQGAALLADTKVAGPPSLSEPH